MVSDERVPVILDRIFQKIVDKWNGYEGDKGPLPGKRSATWFRITRGIKLLHSFGLIFENGELSISNDPDGNYDVAIELTLQEFTELLTGDVGQVMAVVIARKIEKKLDSIHWLLHGGI